MKIRPSTKIWLYKVLHMLLIVALLVPLLPRPGLAQSLQPRQGHEMTVAQAFAQLNAELEAYVSAVEQPLAHLPVQSPTDGSRAGGTGWPFAGSGGVTSSPWDMLPPSPKEGLAGGAEGSMSARFLDPNAQHGSFLESVMPQLAQMPAVAGAQVTGLDGTEARQSAFELATPIVTTPTPTSESASTSPLSVRDVMATATAQLSLLEDDVSQAAAPIEGRRGAESTEVRFYLPLVTHDPLPLGPDVITIAGGVYYSPDKHLSVTIPQQLIHEPVRLSYSSGASTLPAAAALSEDVLNNYALFTLDAHQISDNAPVQQLRRPVELRLKYDDGQIPEREENYLRLHAYNEVLGKWQVLPTAIDRQKQVVTAWSTSFTTFALMPPDYEPEDPCAIATQLAPSFPFVPAPVSPSGNIIPVGIFYNSPTAFDHYIGSEVYVSGSNTGDAQVSDPTLITPFLTQQTAQIAMPQGAWVNGPANATTNFPDPSDRLQTHSLTTQFQHTTMPTWGSTEYWLIRKDVQDPVIVDAWTWHDGEGGVSVFAEVDDNCAVGKVELTYETSSGGGETTVQMEYRGTVADGTGPFETDGLGVYEINLELPPAGTHSYSIEAFDMATYSAEPEANTMTWEGEEMASSSRSFGDSESVRNCSSACGCPETVTCGAVGASVNSSSGNLSYVQVDTLIAGIGDTDIVVARVYNSSRVQRYYNGPNSTERYYTGPRTDKAGPFGVGWASLLNFRVENVLNLSLEGAKVHYPNGHSAIFEGTSGTLTTRTLGEADTLEVAGGGYVLTQKSLTEYHFDADGRLTQIVDANNNTVTFTQGADGPTRIENSAGRAIDLTYNGDGFITQISGPEGLSLNYSYAGDVMTSFSDARGKTTNYSHTSAGGSNPFFHDGENQLNNLNTPKGHAALAVTYDQWGRTTEQQIGAAATYELTYDDPGYTRTIVDANGNSETHDYDNDFRLSKITDARGEEESYAYDGMNLRASLTDKEGRLWSCTHDARSNLTLAEGPLGWQEEFTYNGQDRITAQTDAEGRTTTLAYDGNGNLTEVTNALNGQMTIAYNGQGLPTTVTDYNTHQTSNSYDGSGDLTSIQNGANEITQFAYDGLGRRASMTTHEGSTFTYSYEQGSRLMTDMNGPLTYHLVYSYDDNGNLASQSDANGNQTSYEYDESEKLTLRTDALGGQMSYAYDDMSILSEVTDELGRQTTYEYDEVYHRTVVHAPANRDSSYTYDGVGNQLTVTDPEGRVTTFEYDDLNRQINRTNALGGVSETTYDLVGNTLTVTDEKNHTTSYLYDALNRITDLTNAENESTEYQYDANGNRTQVTDGNGIPMVMTYDAVNRMVSSSNGALETSTFAYDSLGNTTDMVLPNDTPTELVYDALYRRTEVTHTFTPLSAPQSAAPMANVTSRYIYDLNGNLLQTIDPEGNGSTFVYDALNRRTIETNGLSNPTLYTYDAVGNRTSMIDMRGNATFFVYDDADRQTIVTDAQSGAKLYLYDRVGNVIGYTDTNGNFKATIYDALNRPISEADMEGNLVLNLYDAVGNLISQADAGGNLTLYLYDAVDRMTGYTDALNGFTLLQYDEVGNLISTTDSNGNIEATLYDLAYRPIAVTDGDGQVTQYEYDVNGNMTAMIDGSGQRIEMTYDGLDRMVSRTNGANESNSYAYDLLGNLTAKTEPDGVVTTYGYDAIYQLISVRLNGQATYQYSYDENGNLSSINDPLGQTSSFVYDKLNQLTQETDPLGNSWSYDYDPEGNLASQTDANGQTSSYSYYPDNQLQGIQYDDGTSVAYTYDKNNNMTSMVDALGSTSFSYDELDRLTSANDALGRALSYSYDAKGNLTSLTYPHGGTVQYAYEKNDWLREMTDTAGRVTSYERNGVGLVTRSLHSNGAVSEQTYDDANRLTSISHLEENGDLIVSYAYALNNIGFRTEAQIQYGRPWPRTLTEQYSYDGLRRLTEVTDNLGFSASYDYDLAGNRTHWTANDDQTTPQANDAFEINYSYNAANQLSSAVRADETTSYAYDGNGNRINKEWAKTNYPYQYGTDYRYDREDRLVSALNYRINDSLQVGNRRNIEETVLSYDAMGRRLIKEYIEHDGRGRIAMTEYVLDGWNTVAEYPVWEQGEPLGRNNHRNEFYLNGPQTLAFRDMKANTSVMHALGPNSGTSPDMASGSAAPAEIVTQRRFPNGVSAQSYWYHYDGRMNVVSLSEETNRSWRHYQYDAYGQQLPEWGNTPHPEWHEHNQYTVTGKEWDENVGAYYFGARFYDAEVGVWVTQDKYRGVLNEPQSLHRSTFVENNSIQYYDLYGFKSINENDWVTKKKRKWLQDKQVIIEEIATNYKVPASLLAAILFQEGAGSPKLWAKQVIAELKKGIMNDKCKFKYVNTKELVEFKGSRFACVSIGPGQFKPVTAVGLDYLGYSGHKYDPKETVGSIMDRLEDDKWNMRYVAAYIKYANDQIDKKIDTEISIKERITEIYAIYNGRSSSLDARSKDIYENCVVIETTLFKKKGPCQKVQ